MEEFHKKVKENYAPSAEEHGSADEEQEDKGPKKVGHKAEIERIRQKIAENQEKELNKQFLEEAKRIGRARSQAVLRKSAKASVLDESQKSIEPSRANPLTKSKDYLHEQSRWMAKKSELEIL